MKKRGTIRKRSADGMHSGIIDKMVSLSLSYCLAFFHSRSLNQLCLYNLVHNLSTVKKLNASMLPSTFHPLLLSEAIFQREAPSIEWLVSTWPMKLLRVYDIIPLEDYLEDNYLTLPLEEGRQTCLLDCFITGLLKLRPEAGLKYIDFRKFDKGKLLSVNCPFMEMWSFWLTSREVIK